MRRVEQCIAVASCVLTIGACSDNLGVESTSTAVTIVAPARSSVLSGTVIVAAAVEGDAPVAGVLFTLDAVGLGPLDTAPPFEVELDTRRLVNGEHFLRAEARTAEHSVFKSAAVPVMILNTGSLRVHVTIPPGDEGSVASTITIDGEPVGRVPATGGTIELSGLEPGGHWVDLVQPRYDCTTVPGIASPVHIVADYTADLDIQVECAAVPNLHVAFAMDGDIYRSRLDGSELVNITNSPGRSESAPDWSPDGSRLVYVVSGALLVANADGLGEIQLQVPDGEKSSPRWSPDGSQILFANDSLGSTLTPQDQCWYYWCSHHRIFVVPADGGTAREVAVDEEAYGFDDIPGGWSRDGSRIVFERDTGSCSLKVAETDGGPLDINRVTCAYGSADWGPDDRIAFTVSGVWSTDLATVNADGTGLAVLQASRRGNEHNPRWTEDGEWLVFLDDDRITVTRADGFGRYHALQGVRAQSLALLP